MNKKRTGCVEITLSRGTLHKRNNQLPGPVAVVACDGDDDDGSNGDGPSLCRRLHAAVFEVGQDSSNCGGQTAVHFGSRPPRNDHVVETERVGRWIMALMLGIAIIIPRRVDRQLVVKINAVWTCRVFKGRSIFLSSHKSMQNPWLLSVLWTDLAAAEIAFANMKRHDGTSTAYNLHLYSNTCPSISTTDQRLFCALFLSFGHATVKLVQRHPTSIRMLFEHAAFLLFSIE